MFSKAPVTRFNEKVSCSPPVTKYNPQIPARVKGLIPLSHQKSERFSVPSTARLTSPSETQQSVGDKSSWRALSTCSRSTSPTSDVTRSSTTHKCGSTFNKKSSASQYALQKHKYMKLNKELEEKQASIISLYSSLLKLRELMIKSGGPEVDIPKQPKIICTGYHGGGETFQNVLDVREKSEFVSSVQQQLEEMASCYLALCHKLLNVNNEILTEMSSDQVKVIIGDEGRNRIEKFVEEGKSLSKVLEDTNNTKMNIISNLLNKISILLHEKELLKNNQTESLSLAQVEGEKNEMIQKLEEEINIEKLRKVATEALLAEARQKIRDVESKVVSQEDKMKSFNSQMKMFENQMKAKEQNFHKRLQDLTKTIRHLTEAKDSLKKQKEALEERQEENKRLLRQKDEEIETLRCNVVTNINDLNDALSKEIMEKKELQDKLDAALKSKEEMERKLLQKTEAPKKTAECARGSKSTKQEDELREQLQSTKILLHSTEEELSSIKAENKKLQESLNSMSNAGKSSEALTAEIANKEKDIKKLNDKTTKLSAELNDRNKLVLELKKKLNEVEKQKNQRSPSSESTKIQESERKNKTTEMENEVSMLREQKAQIDKNLMKMRAELENKEHLAKEQAKAIKAKDEMIRMLKGSEKKQAEQIADMQALLNEHDQAALTVRQSIMGKGVELTEMQKTLELKQLQILRLEKLLKKLEEQQERWALQRTRHEARIAELESALRDKQRYSGNLLSKGDSLHTQEASTETRMVEKHIAQNMLKTEPPYNSTTNLVNENQTQPLRRQALPDDSHENQDLSIQHFNLPSVQKISGGSKEEKEDRPNNIHISPNPTVQTSDIPNGEINGFNKNNNLQFCPQQLDTSPWSAIDKRLFYDTFEQQLYDNVNNQGHVEFETTLYDTKCLKNQFITLLPNSKNDHHLDYSNDNICEQPTGNEAVSSIEINSKRHLYPYFNKGRHPFKYFPMCESANNNTEHRKIESKSDPIQHNNNFKYNCIRRTATENNFQKNCNSGRKSFIQNNGFVASSQNHNKHSYKNYNTPEYMNDSERKHDSKFYICPSLASKRYLKQTPCNKFHCVYCHTGISKSKRFVNHKNYQASELNNYEERFIIESSNKLYDDRRTVAGNGCLNCQQHISGRKMHTNKQVSNNTSESPFILCASPSLVLMLDCPYIINHILNRKQLKNW